MTPRHVAADLHHQVGFLQIIVAAGHDIFAKGTDMTR
jgi:hypothetical protein